MTEGKEVGYVSEGIADDAFNLFICESCTTVDAIPKESR